MGEPSSRPAGIRGRHAQVGPPGGIHVALDLLDALTSDQELPADLLARLTAGSAAAQAAEVRRRVDEARAEVSRWRRRDQQLSALFSSARELAELRDVGPLLDRLVQRAHDLVGSDVMYLSRV